MHPPRLLLSDARIAVLEASVAHLLGRVTVLEAALPDLSPTNPSVLRPPSPLQEPGPDAESFAAASFPSAHSFDAGASARRTPYHYSYLDYALPRGLAADTSAAPPRPAFAFTRTSTTPPSEQTPSPKNTPAISVFTTRPSPQQAP